MNEKNSKVSEIGQLPQQLKFDFGVIAVQDALFSLHYLQGEKPNIIET